MITKNDKSYEAWAKVIVDVTELVMGDALFQCLDHVSAHKLKAVCNIANEKSDSLPDTLNIVFRPEKAETWYRISVILIRDYDDPSVTCTCCVVNYNSHEDMRANLAIVRANFIIQVSCLALEIERSLSNIV